MSNLESVCKLITRGKAPEYAIDGQGRVVKSAQVYPNGINWAGCPRVSDAYVAQFEDQYLLKNGDVLLNGTGTGTLGRPAIVWDVPEGTYIPDSHVTLIRPDQCRIDPVYLFYWLLSPECQMLIELAAIGSTNQIELPASRVAELPLPHLIPPLAEQRRIAAILRAADDERRRRRYTQTLSDGLLAEVFVRMFGDPATNPMGWEVAPVENLLTHTRKGIQTGPFGSALKRHEYVDSGIPVWGIDNVTAFGFQEDRSLHITQDKFLELSSYSVDDGDVLISRAGTVGRMCVAHPSQQLSIIGTNLVRVGLDKNQVLPEYFVTLFTAFSLASTQLRASGDETGYSFMNPETLRSTWIMVPSLATQKEFIIANQQHDQTRRQQQESARQSDHLFDTLLHRAFSGEL